MILRTFAAVLLSLGLAAPAMAAQCGGSFDGFLAQMARDAQAQGVSAGVVNAAFSGLTINPQVMAFDRRQAATFRRKATSRNSSPPVSVPAASSAPRR